MQEAVTAQALVEALLEFPANTSVQHVDFQILAEEEYAASLIECGEMRMYTLATYQTIEDQDVRGDPSDGLLRYRPEGGVTMNQGRPLVPDRPGIRVGGQGQRNLRLLHEQPVLAGVGQAVRLPNLHRDRSPGQIYRPDLPVGPDALASRLPQRTCTRGRVPLSDNRTGRGIGRFPNHWDFMKPDAFGWQDEFRVVVGVKGALGVANVDMVLEGAGGAQGRSRRPRAARPQNGKLSDIAKLHRL